jgi:hypothetical protein
MDKKLIAQLLQSVSANAMSGNFTQARKAMAQLEAAIDIDGPDGNPDFRIAILKPNADQGVDLMMSGEGTA